MSKKTVNTCDVAILLIVVIAIARAFTSFYIIPNSSEDRPHLCPPDVYCYSIQEILDNHSDYFTSNTILELAPGIYNMYGEVSLRIANITNFVVRTSDAVNYGNNIKVELSCTPHGTFTDRMMLTNKCYVITQQKYDYIFVLIDNSFNISLSNTGTKQ